MDFVDVHLQRPSQQFVDTYMMQPVQMGGYRWTPNGPHSLWIPLSADEQLLNKGRYKGRRKKFTSANKFSMKALFKRWELLKQLHPACLVNWLQFPALKKLCWDKGEEGIRLYLRIAEAARQLSYDGYYQHYYPEAMPTCADAPPFIHERNEEDEL